MKILQQNKWFLSIMACLILIICAVFFTCEFSVSAERSSAADRYISKIDYDDESPDQYFCIMANAAADLLNNVKSGRIDDGLEPLMPDESDMNVCAGMLGFTHSYVEPINDVTLSWYSANSENEGTYTLVNFDADGYKNYAKMGIILNQLGIDQTRSNTITGTSRQVVGLLVLCLYILSAFIGQFWCYVLDVLSILNPFILLNGGYQDSILAPLNAGLGTGRIYKVDWMQSVVSAIVDAFGGFYQSVYSLAKDLLLPFMLVCIIFVWLIFNKGREAGKTIKGLLIRVLFVAIGLPVLAAVYTAGLDCLDTMVVGSVQTTDSIIASTFVDFENYAKTTYLSSDCDDVFKFDDYDEKREKVKDKGVADDVRIRCKTINTKYLGDLNLDLDGSVEIKGIKPKGDPEPGLSAYDLEMIKKLFTEYKSDGFKVAELNASQMSNMPKIVDMLLRYAGERTYSAASFESEYRAGKTFGDLSTVVNANTVVNRLYLSSNQWQDFLMNDLRDMFYNNTAYADGDADFTGERALIWRIRDDQKSVLKKRFENESETLKGMENMASVYWGYNTSDISEDVSLKGLSAIGMYNYLSSSFSPKEIVVTSGYTTNAQTQKFEHMSVNVVGNTYMNIIYVLDVITLLCALNVVSYGYGLGLIISCVKTSFKFIFDVIGGSFGLMRSIAASLVLVFAFVGEILITCGLYALTTTLVPNFYKLIEIPLSVILEPLCDAIDGQVYPIVSGIISILAVAFLIGKMLQFRKAVCSSIIDMFRSIVNKLTGVEVANPNIL